MIISSKTPRSDAILHLGDLFALCREFEIENAKLHAALEFIASEGGKERETECGYISCNGSWCADQARAALP